MASGALDRGMGTVAKHDIPITPRMVTLALEAAGLARGDVVLAHASVSALGWVMGHAATLVRSVLEVIGPTGTLMAPAFSADLTEPSLWQEPPVPQDWWPLIRDEMPAFDIGTTPSFGVGQFPEAVRTWPGAMRSNHPRDSFVAIGPHADALLRDQKLEEGFGAGSPLAKLVGLNGKVVFLGSWWSTPTIFHYAEHEAGVLTHAEQGSPMMVDGRRKWVIWREPAYSADDFPQCGEAFEATGAVRAITLGAGKVRCFSARQAVAFAAGWLRQNRKSQ